MKRLKVRSVKCHLLLAEISYGKQLLLRPGENVYCRILTDLHIIEIKSPEIEKRTQHIHGHPLRLKAYCARSHGRVSRRTLVTHSLGCKDVALTLEVENIFLVLPLLMGYIHILHRIKTALGHCRVKGVT